MAYNKTIWKDRVIEKTMTFNMVQNEDGTITLIPAPGVVTEEGTKFTAEKMNNIENGIGEVEKAIGNVKNIAGGKSLGTFANEYSTLTLNDNIGKYKKIILKCHIKDYTEISNFSAEIDSDSSGLYGNFTLSSYKKGEADTNPMLFLIYCTASNNKIDILGGCNINFVNGTFSINGRDNNSTIFVDEVLGYE